MNNSVISGGLSRWRMLFFLVFAFVFVSLMSSFASAQCTCQGGSNAGYSCYGPSDCDSYDCYCEPLWCYRCECGIIESRFESSGICDSTNNWVDYNPSPCGALPCSAMESCYNNAGIWCGGSSGFCQYISSSPRACTVQSTQTVRLNNANLDYEYSYEFTSFTVNTGVTLSFVNYNSPRDKGNLGFCDQVQQPETVSNIYYQGGRSSVCDSPGEYGKRCGLCDWFWGGGGGDGAPGALQFYRGGSGAQGMCGVEETNDLPPPMGSGLDCWDSSGVGGSGGYGGTYSGGNVFINVSGSFSMLASAKIIANGANGYGGGNGVRNNNQPATGGGGGGAGAGAGSIRIWAGSVSIPSTAKIEAAGGAGGKGGSGRDAEANTDPDDPDSCAGGSGGGGGGGDVMVISPTRTIGSCTSSFNISGGKGGAKADWDESCWYANVAGGVSGDSGHLLVGANYCSGSTTCGSGYSCDWGGRLPYCAMSGFNYYHASNTCNNIVNFEYCYSRDSSSSCGGTSGCEWNIYYSCVPWNYPYNNWEYYDYYEVQNYLAVYGTTYSNCFGQENEMACRGVANHYSDECVWRDFGWCGINYDYCESMNQATCNANPATCIWGEAIDYANNACCGDDGAADLNVIKGGKECTVCTVSVTDESGRSLISGRYYWVHNETGEYACDGYDNDCDGLRDSKDTDAGLNCCVDSDCTAFPGAGVCNAGVCSYPCNYGTDCGGINLCVDGTCANSCNAQTSQRLCSDDGTHRWTADGICTTETATGCDETVAAGYDPATATPYTFYGSCSLAFTAGAPVGTPCDLNSLAGGYSATGTCALGGNCLPGGCTCSGSSCNPLNNGQVCNTCNYVPAPAENCANGVDDDCDGAADCADSQCSSLPVCTGCTCSGSSCNPLNNGQVCNTCNYVPAPAENCANGVDDDCDGAADCADSQCSSLPVCTGCTCSGSSCNPLNNGQVCNTCNYVPAPAENCANGVDDDCDGDTDGADSDCVVLCNSFDTSRHYFEIRSSSNAVLARINQDGVFWVRGVQRPWVVPPAGNHFIIRNSANNPVFWIHGTTGDVYSLGSINQNYVGSPSGSGNFVIQNSAGTSRAWVTSSGSMYLAGCFGAGKTFT